MYEIETEGNATYPGMNRTGNVYRAVCALAMVCVSFAYFPLIVQFIKWNLMKNGEEPWLKRSQTIEIGVALANIFDKKFIFFLLIYRIHSHKVKHLRAMLLFTHRVIRSKQKSECVVLFFFRKWCKLNAHSIIKGRYWRKTTTTTADERSNKKWFIIKKKTLE